MNTLDIQLLLQPGTRYYFLGIGGIGMSALARYLKHMGCVVEGYDRTETPLTQALVAEGIPVVYTMTTDWLAAVDVVVYTPAVKDHPGLEGVRSAGKHMYKRAELLGALSRLQPTLAVAGTHGKTTTSSMLAHLLRHAGTDNTAFVGGIMVNYESNLLMGKGKWMVCEADEFDRSFLQLSPRKAIITSTDADHLDIYGTAEAVREGYHLFAERVLADGGSLLLNSSLKDFAADLKGDVRFYGREDATAIHAQRLRSEGLTMRFDYIDPRDGFRMEDLTLRMPGLHNVENALAALALARQAGLPEAQLRNALAAYKGVHRRFEIHLDTPSLYYIDDYAHHPAEIEAVLRAIRALLPNHWLLVAFQPHLFTRTRDFHQGFGAALSLADEVVLAPIYPARELSIPHVTSELIYTHINSTYKHLVFLDDLTSTLSELVRPQTVVVTLGAGDIDTQVSPLKAALEARLRNA